MAARAPQEGGGGGGGHAFGARRARVPERTGPRGVARRRGLVHAAARALLFPLMLHVTLSAAAPRGQALRAGHAAAFVCGQVPRPGCGPCPAGPARAPGTPPRSLGLRGGCNDPGTPSADVSASQKKEAEKMEHDKALIGELQAMRNDCSKLKKRLNMLGEEIQEHAEAAQVLEKVDGARPCKRAVGGVLIDSTVGEVLPALYNEMTMLTKASDDITGKLDELQKQMAAFTKKHDIRIVSEELEPT
jgi:prefoldin subunit 2